MVVRIDKSKSHNRQTVDAMKTILMTTELF